MGSNACNNSLSSGVILNSFNHPNFALNFFPSNSKWVLTNFKRRFLNQHGCFRRRHACFCCQTTQTEELQKRRCSPLLEHEILSNTVLLGSSEWKAVPDIWRTAAEKYGDRTALIDRYHEPSLELTYKELEQEILDFSEGLRIVGVKPDDKVALFADNSCRWLIADQATMAMGAINVVRGSRSSTEELLQIYNHSESVALLVDNPELFNRMEDLFIAQANMKFMILLWGDKSDLIRGVCDTISVFNYSEITEMGKESRNHLVASYDASKAICSYGFIFYCSSFFFLENVADPNYETKALMIDFEKKFTGFHYFGHVRLFFGRLRFYSNSNVYKAKLLTSNILLKQVLSDCLKSRLLK